MATIDSKRKLLNDQFYKVFVKFSLKEFNEHLHILFEDVTWSAIEKAIHKFNVSKKMSDIGKIFLEYTKSYSFEDLQTLYYNLLNLDIVLHNRRKQWTAVLLKHGEEKEQPLDENCVNDIIREFRKNAMNVRITITTSDDILWFVLVVLKRTKSNGVKHQKPHFFARHIDYPYLFYSPKNCNENVLKFFVSGFGYNDHKICKLNGNDVSSLVKMLNKQKKAVKHRAETSLVLKKPVADCVRLAAKGIDYCQDKVRSVHAQQILGNEEIKLETLTVKANTEWRGLRTLPEADGTQVSMTVKMKAKNIQHSLDEMIKAGFIHPPYPEWVKEFFISGKNVISIA